MDVQAFKKNRTKNKTKLASEGKGSNFAFSSLITNLDIYTFVCVCEYPCIFLPVYSNIEVVLIKQHICFQHSTFYIILLQHKKPPYIQQLTTTHIYYLTGSVVRRPGLAGSSARGLKRLQSQPQPGTESHRSLGSPFRLMWLLVKFISLQLYNSWKFAFSRPVGE